VSANLPLATLCLVRRRGSHDEILLGHKKRGFGAGKYDGFGGKVHAGETVAAAAARELAEECGLAVSPQDLAKVAELTFTFPHKPAWNQVVHTFLVERWRGDPQESEEMSPAWFPITEIPYDAMWDDSIFWLPLLLAGKRITARFTFRADNETVAWAEIEVAGDRAQAEGPAALNHRSLALPAADQV
jgi:8-oxo-dGTP diphosphatase